MEEFRRQFTLEAVAALENLSKDFQSAEAISDSQKGEIFRRLHTVKGTSQTFGYQTSSRLAHRLETLLAESKINPNSENDNFKSLFAEGIELLIESLKRKDFEIPASFAERIGVAVPDMATSSPDSYDDSLLAIPDDFLTQLSVQEQNTLRTALKNEKNLFCLEAGFELKNFADGLINLRESLASLGEIIATLPAAKFNEGGKIGFQILLASSAAASEVAKIAEKSAAEIIFDSSPNNYTGDADGVLAQIVNHGKAVAEKLGKRVRFQTSAAAINLAPGELKLVFDVLLHLVRNAVDHAFDDAGEIKINLQTEKNHLRLIVSDDGRGIDAEKIKRQAVEKNRLAADKILTVQEAIDLIFLPEFSTKSIVTDISGRGVGLDAVRDAVEKVGGTINVESRIGKGTTFEICLPQQF
ncbi:MAG: Hpt domain-containing protein [Pyrinomonadaceae bacterium]|nr:Hpt domain-containing protein [Pyrinomonadaceae bacterium]